jgi:hypothetical protein
MEKWLRHVLRIERHKLGPRVFLLGRRVHEYQFGFVVLGAVPAAIAAELTLGTAAAAVAGLWLVIKDWPDLLPATRDKASWRIGVHRLPPRKGGRRSG